MLGDETTDTAPREASAVRRGLRFADETWQRVEPRFVWIELASLAIAAAVLLLLSLAPVLVFHAPQPQGWIGTAVLVVVFAILFVVVPRRVRAIGYVLRENDLLFRRGLMWQRVVAVPYGRMQIVDVKRGPLSRAFGLAELEFVTAAASTNVTIPGLSTERADALRDHLVAVAETRRAGL